MVMSGGTTPIHAAEPELPTACTSEFCPLPPADSPFFAESVIGSGMAASANPMDGAKCADMSLKIMQYELMLMSRKYMKPLDAGDVMLERSAYVLLCRLEHAAPMTLKEISEALGLDASTINRQVAASLRQAHLEYVPNSTGQAARRVVPTKSGLAAMVETRRIFERGLEKVVGDWPEPKKQQFIDLLLDFNHQVEALEGNAWPRPQE